MGLVTKSLPAFGMTLPLIPQAGGSTGLLMDLAANEKAVHADFFNGEYARSGCQA